MQVGVHKGSSTSLDVTYAAPVSDGGGEILSYRVELDISLNFLNPIYNIFPCAAGSTHSIFQIETAGFPGDPIVSGYYSLTLTRNRASFVTDPIAFDATASSADEAGIRTRILGTLATLTNGSALINSTFDATKLIFPGDRLIFDSNKQMNKQEYFTVVSVVKFAVTLASPVVLSPTAVAGNSYIYRYSGGRGTTLSSRVACTADSALCPPNRLQISGSIQSKLESIPEALVLGVQVDRNPPDAYNGNVYRVSFLDASLRSWIPELQLGCYRGQQ